MTVLKCLLSCRTCDLSCGAGTRAEVLASNAAAALLLGDSEAEARAASTAACASTAICSGDLRLPELSPNPNLPLVVEGRPSGETAALKDPLGPEKLSVKLPVWASVCRDGECLWDCDGELG